MTLRGDRITQLRKQIGMKQSELAEALGIVANQVSKYENGYANPTLESLDQLCDLFNTTADYLLGRSDIPHPGAEPDANADLTHLEVELLKLFRERAVVDQKRVLEILTVMRNLRPVDPTNDE